jgi:hypothetical protein
MNTVIVEYPRQPRRPGLGLFADGLGDLLGVGLLVRERVHQVVLLFLLADELSLEDVPRPTVRLPPAPQAPLRQLRAPSTTHSPPRQHQCLLQPPSASSSLRGATAGFQVSFCGFRLSVLCLTRCMNLSLVETTQGFGPTPRRNKVNKHLCNLCRRACGSSCPLAYSDEKVANRDVRDFG